MDFQATRAEAGLSLALGTQEVHPLDLATGYATIANGGRYIGHTTILTIQDAAGKDVMLAVRARRPETRPSARRPPTS